MKKTLLVALCSVVMSANAEYKLNQVEEAAWTNLNSSEFANNDYIGEWGRLKLVGNQLCSEKGNPIQLRGWSTNSINYDEVLPCLAENGFKAMKTWGANIVRLAVYPKNSKGSYSSTTDLAIEKYIRYASEQKMYVLVDWHVSDSDGNSGDPATYKDQAIQMFTNITKFCSDNGYSNVLYEICSDCYAGTTEEPDVTWADIKSYANEVLPVIENGDPGAIVVIGVPHWDQNILEAVESPIEPESYPDLGLMYAFHFSACNHMYLIGNMQKASASLPIFVSQWSTTTYDDAGTTLCDENATYFMSYLRPEGNNGGQLISWCNWAWGQKDGALYSMKDCSTDYNSATLSASGNYVASLLTGSVNLNDYICGCAPKWAAEIPYSTYNWGVLNVGKYDLGGEGVAYHDNNSSMFIAGDHTKLDTTGTEYECCNAGAVYSGQEDLTTCFRYDECVDVSNATAGLGANWGEPGDGLLNVGADLHNLCMTESGEWILYTINVTKAGYYTVKCLTNSNTSSLGSIGMAIAKGTQPRQNGNIIRSWADHNDKDAIWENPWTSFAINPTPSCGLMYDGTINEEGAANGKKDESWTCWGWTDCGKTAADKEDLVVLFKYTGEQKLQILISPDTKDSPGDFSNFAFTLKSEEIPDFELAADGVENEPADMSNIYLYPNPTSGAFTVKLNGAANVSIYDAVGAQVYNKDVEGDVTVNNKFAPGIYTVRVVTANGTKCLKLEEK